MFVLRGVDQNGGILLLQFPISLRTSKSQHQRERPGLDSMKTGENFRMRRSLGHNFF